MLGEGRTVRAVNFEAARSRWCDAEFEAGGINDQIDWILRAAEHDSVAADPVDAPALRVDQRDIPTVASRQVVVAEARPLAETAVVGLERSGGLRVADLLVDPGPDPLQFREVHVGQLGHGALDRAFGHSLGYASPDRGPLVPDQVLVLAQSREDRIEVLHPVALPAGLLAGEPVRIGRSIAPTVHNRRGTLHHVQVLGIPGDGRDDLYRAGSGTDHGDPLVPELGHPALFGAAGVVVVPPAAVKLRAFEPVDAGYARQFRPVERTAAQHHVASPELIGSIGPDHPAGLAG